MPNLISDSSTTNISIARIPRKDWLAKKGMSSKVSTVMAKQRYFKSIATLINNFDLWSCPIPKLWMKTYKPFEFAHNRRAAVTLPKLEGLKSTTPENNLFKSQDEGIILGKATRNFWERIREYYDVQSTSTLSIIWTYSTGTIHIFNIWDFNSPV